MLVGEAEFEISSDVENVVERVMVVGSEKEFVLVDDASSV